MFTKFLKEEDGAQVVEYSLIIAMISIGLVLALQPSTIAASFGNFIGRVSSCLTTGPCIQFS
ncbi:Flp family type IVb pilin [Polaromonas sp.]|uniref:Flp family type IVb pilin n=1 Tax=Polaromonas sp. TaxID=1869339 RepID=UPI001D49A337|nr:Flp family type IVb pilin [Polaromonas sp.]MBT9476794.1 Flp family type IVb pilin [Polaromonas sp.]